MKTFIHLISHIIFKQVALHIKFFLLLPLFILSLHAADYTCDGENVANINGASGDAYQAYSTGPDISENSRYFKFRTAIDGEITIHQTNNKPVGGYWNHELTVGTSCQGTNIYNGPNTSNDSTTFTVTANTWYYVRVRERNNQNVLNFDITFDFTAAAPSIDACPGIVIPNLEGTSVTATDNFSNVTVPASTIYYYHFTPTAAGTIQVNSSANKYSNSLYIKDGCGANLWSNTSNTNDKSSPEIDVAANQQIVIAFERRYTSSLTLNIDFTFTVVAETPPMMGNVPNQSTNIGEAFSSLDISNYVTLTNGDPITTYTLSGTLPTGLTFNSSTGLLSGTPTQSGTFNLSVTATDNDGVSNADNFTIIVNPGTPPIMGDVPNISGSLGSVITPLDVSTYVTLTNGDPITAYTLSGTLPSGLTFNSSTGTLSGTPTQVGTFSLSVTATDKDGVSNADSFSITVGCNGTFDASDAANSPPGTIITTMHGITADTRTCINGSSPNSDDDYYYFTVDATGTLDITTSSPNSHDFRLWIGSTSGGEELYSNTTTQSHAVPQIALSSGDSVYIRVRESGYDTDEYQIHFDFRAIAPAPPVMGNIPDQTLELGTPLTLSLATYVTEPNGDPITYAIAGTLPAGLSFDPSIGLISGTPTVLGSFDLSATATDKDGTSNADAFTITVTTPSAPVANDNSYTTALNTVLSGNVLTNDTGYNITVTANTLPSSGSLAISANGSFTYTPTLNFVGIDTFEYTITDGFDRNDTAQVTITVEPDITINEGYRPFSLRTQSNLIGKMVTIGNTVLVAPTDQSSNVCNTYKSGNYISDASNANNNYELCSYWADSNAVFPTTRAQLSIPNSGVNIQWVGLYWQALVDDGFDVTNMEIKLKHEVSTSYTSTPYETIKFNSLDYGVGVGHAGQTSYSAFANLTNLFISKGWKNGYVTVGDIPIQEGQIDTLGTYGAWTLVVIYKDPTEKLQNFSIFDGWQQVDSDHPEVDIGITGFYAPKSAPIAAGVSVFAAEGDKHINNDYLKVKPSKKSTWTSLSHTSNQTFNSSIQTTESFTRVPNPVNNQGIDIQAFDLGSTGEDIMEPEEVAIDFKFGSDQDRYWPSMIAFSAELYKPNVCYDYVVKRDEYTISSYDQSIDTYINVDEHLSITVAVKSLESDFDLTSSKLAITMHDTNGSVLFESGEYSPTTSNILLSTGTTATSTPSRPEIAIGKNRNALTGGTIGNYERYYAKYNYLVNEIISSKFQTEFNIELNTTVDYGSGPVSQILDLSRCEQSPVYNPVWGQFNVERDFTGSVPPISEPTARYSLYTQIAGKDFDYSVAHYDDSDPVNPQSISNATVDVELIDATAFDDNSSFLKCSNTDPSIIIGGLHNSTFVKFGASATDRVSIRESLDLVDVPALKSAVFRMWTLLDENGTLIYHNNNKEDGHKFREIYNDNYRDTLDLATPKLCGTACNATNGVANNTSCYECLRTYFATPNCSRDNFAVRPESYRISLSDTGADGENSATPLGITTNDSTMSEKSLAAEYKYKMTGYSTKYGGVSIAERYYNENFLTATPNMITFPNVTDDIVALQFNGPTACQDTNHTTVNLSFSNGSIDDYNLSHDNAGDYNLWIEDNRWTRVDQADRNPYKTIFDPNCRAATLTSTVPAGCNDCILGDNSSTTAPKVGCQTDSSIVSDPAYNDVELRFEPYQFDLSTIAFRTNPNDNGTHLYMGDLNKSLVMAAKLEGNITAEGKEGTVLSNFTDGCAAEDVILWLDRTMTPQESMIQSEDGIAVAFQQVLQDIYDINTFSTDTNSTLEADNFSNAADINGSAEVDLYFNFEKPYAQLVNPIDVNFSVLNAVSPNAVSNANMVSDYIPDGNRTIDQQRYFYFAKVSPPDGVDGAETYEVLVSTILKVNTFCRDDVNTTCALLPGLPTVPEDVFPGGGWYRMEGHLSSLGDGQVNNLSTTVAGVGISPSSNITFDINGSTSDIDITYPLSGRPVHPVIQIDPDEWLKYNPDVSKNGLPEFTIHFLNQGLKWKGEGKTGHVVGTEPSTGSNQRINW